MIREWAPDPGRTNSLIAAVEALQPVALPDTIPLSLGVETHGREMARVVERGTPIPTRRSATFSTSVDGQRAVDIPVLQGERHTAGDNRVIGRLWLGGIRAARQGEPQIDVTFDIDADGVVEVTARDRDTGAEQSITISEGANLRRCEIDRMIADSEP